MDDYLASLMVEYSEQQWGIKGVDLKVNYWENLLEIKLVGYLANGLVVYLD
jgi:hypothetical protein